MELKVPHRSLEITTPEKMSIYFSPGKDKFLTETTVWKNSKTDIIHPQVVRVYSFIC